jgi:hypothetical protein
VLIKARREAVPARPFVRVPPVLRLGLCEIRVLPTGTAWGAALCRLKLTAAFNGGPMSRTASINTFGFFQAYSGTKSVFGGSQTCGGNVAVKAILTSPDNHGLRCDMTGDGWGHAEERGSV